MRRLLTLVVAVVGAAVVGAQERAPRDYVAAALDILEENSVKRREIEWPTFRADLLKKTESARTIPETYDAIRNAVRALGDHHSSFFEPSVVATMNQRGAALSPLPESHRVEGHIGQLVIPSFGGSDPDAMQKTATTIQTFIKDLDAGGVCGWIVDLRSNGGGNMWPMLAGLGPIVGEGTLGAFVDSDGSKGLWTYQHGSSGVGNRFIVTVPEPYVPKNQSRAVAVLISETTASSGEAVAVAFHARPQTRFFGHTTRGLATANAMFRLSDGAAINLTNAVMADRNGDTFPDGIKPDETAFWESVAEVPKVVTNWLLGQPACRE